MGIAPVIVHLDLERGWRGGQRQVALLIGAMQGSGYAQSLVARRGGELARRSEAVPGLTLFPVSGRWEALKVLGRLPGPRLLHAHSGNTVPLAVLARRKGDAALATRRLDRRVNPFWWRRLARVVSISASVEKSLLAAGIPAPRIVRIPSTIDTGRPLRSAERGRRREELGLPENAVLGLTVGALVPQKDPLTLVRALSRLPAHYHHLWLGDGPLRRETAALAAKAGLAPRLHLPGFAEDPDPWFAAADLFVLPSRHEGLGTTLLDAFLYGLPVAGTRIPGTAELLEEGVTAVLTGPGDPPGLAGAVRRLMEEPELRARLAAAGRRRLAGFSLGAAVQAYQDLYRELFDNPLGR